MGFVGQHAAHLLELLSSLRRIAVQQSISMPDAIIVDRNSFEIDLHAISDTKVVTTIAGGKIPYEADAK